MKDDEKTLLLRCTAYGPVMTPDGPKDGTPIRTLVGETGLPKKRAYYLLSKWADKGWYDYGTSLDLGWMTGDGLKAAVEVPLP